MNVGRRRQAPTEYIKLTLSDSAHTIQKELQGTEIILTRQKIQEKIIQQDNQVTSAFLKFRHDGKAVDKEKFFQLAFHNNVIDDLKPYRYDKNEFEDYWVYNHSLRIDFGVDGKPSKYTVVYDQADEDGSAKSNTEYPNGNLFKPKKP